MKSELKKAYFTYKSADPEGADRLLDQELADSALRERIRKSDLKSRRALGMLPE